MEELFTKKKAEESQIEEATNNLAENESLVNETQNEENEQVNELETCPSTALYDDTPYPERSEDELLYASLLSDEYVDYYVTEDGKLAIHNPYEYPHDLEHILAQGDTDSSDGIILLATKKTINGYSYTNDGVLDIRMIVKFGVKISNNWKKTANTLVGCENKNLLEGQGFPYFKKIPPRAVALLLMATGEFRLSINVYGEKNGILMRQRAGKDIGTWVEQKANSVLDRLIDILNGDANERYHKEVKSKLMTELEACNSPDSNTIIRLQDGVYDCVSREFISYLDVRYEERYGHLVSQSKLYGVEWTYKTFAELEKECTIHNDEDGTDWSPIQGLIDLVGDGIALQTLREIMHFAIRRMSGGYAWWFLNTTGNAAGGGGKSTVIQIIKNLVGGERNALTKSYDHLGDRFALVGLEKKYVIVSDETEGANKKPDDTSVYKALSTNGTVGIDKKFEKEYYIKWSGVMIQAINGIPLFSDNSDSTYRRLLALPWEKNMTQNGQKRDYIRDDYINRPEVIQCYMKWALGLGCPTTYSKEVIAYCLPYVEMMKSGVKTVYEFMPEMMRRIQDENYFDGMNELGRSFLYALYCKWDEVDNCNRNHISQKKFWLSVCEWVQSHTDCGWETTDNTLHIYPNTPYQQELVDYDLGPQWCTYSGNCPPKPTGRFSCLGKTIRSGLLRVNKLPKNTNQNRTQGNPAQINP